MIMRNYFKQVVIYSFLLCGFNMSTAFSTAQNYNFWAGNGETYATPEKYEFTFYDVSFCTNANCDISYLVAVVPGGKKFDIASVNTGGDIASLASEFTLPPAGITLTHVSFTIDRTQTIKGSVANVRGQSKNCRTNQSGSIKDGELAGRSNFISGANDGDTPTDMAFYVHDGIVDSAVELKYHTTDANEKMVYTLPLKTPSGEITTYTVPAGDEGEKPIIKIVVNAKDALVANLMNGSDNPDNAGDCVMTRDEPVVRVSIE